jgi:hypothetical protein
MKLSVALKNMINYIPEGIEKEVIKDFIASKEETPTAGKAYAYRIEFKGNKVVRSDETFPTEYWCKKAMLNRIAIISVYSPLEVIDTEVFDIYKRVAELEKRKGG